MNRPNTYMPQLDALRAIAVLLVIVSHWFGRTHLLNRYTDNGMLGVTLFFVLSGYLITGILLKNKTSIEKGGSLKDALKTFYIRRSLRIFPVYYLLIFVLLAFNIADISKSFGWHFLYLSNVYIWYTNEFPGTLSHFWSLAVEEQFYMFWPALIFFVPRSKIVITLLGGVMFATIFRLLMYSPPEHFGRLLMPASLDSFCIGGLLAYGQQYSKGWYKWSEQHFKILFTVVVVLFIGITIAQLKFQAPVSDYLLLGSYFGLISVLFVLIITKCSIGVDNQLLKIVLNNKWLIYLGKISYGLYLYHNFIPYLYNLPLPVFLDPVGLYVVQFIRLVLLIGLSTFSWYLIEKPLLKLKDRFSYSSQAVKASKIVPQVVSLEPSREVNIGK